jgi:hypothetical protein
LDDFSRKEVGYPNPASLRPDSIKPKKRIGTPKRAARRKLHNLLLEMGRVLLAELRFGFLRLIGIVAKVYACVKVGAI